MAGNRTIETHNSDGPGFGTMAGIGMGLTFLLVARNLFGGQSQSDRSKQIKESQNILDQLPVKTYSLTKDKAAYRGIADSIYQHLDDENHGDIWNSFKYPDIVKDLKGLNAEELREVARQFGYRSATVFFAWKGSEKYNIFNWFEKVMNTTQLNEMRYIWQPSGLWGFGLSTGQKNAVLSKLWKPIYQSEAVGLRVYPGYTTIPLHQYDAKGNFVLIKNLPITIYWQLGKITGVAKVEGGVPAKWVKIQITNAAYPTELGIEFWVATTYLNKSQPPSDPWNFPVENKTYKL